MLLKFNQPDILNTELIDTSSGRPRYAISTRASYIASRDNVIVDVTSRCTTIVDVSGQFVAEIEWTGNEKKSGGLIRVMDDEPIKLTELFGGCDSVDAELVPRLPAKFFHLTPIAGRSLFRYPHEDRYANIPYTCNSDSREAFARFHERCIQLNNKLSPSPIPKVGNDFLEFSDLPEKVIVELLVGFIFINIMRRTHSRSSIHPAQNDLRLVIF